MYFVFVTNSKEKYEKVKGFKEATCMKSLVVFQGIFLLRNLTVDRLFPENASFMRELIYYILTSICSLSTHCLDFC